MKELTGWKSCLEKSVKKVEVDQEKALSIFKMCLVRERVIPMIQRDEETISPVTEDYYEIIKELLVCLMLLHGMKSKDHECLIAFFKEYYPEYDAEVAVIHELKKVRNRIDYEGFFVPESYLKMNELEFKHIITLLRKKIEAKVPNLR